MATETVTTCTCDWCGKVISSVCRPNAGQICGVAVTTKVKVKSFWGMLGSSTRTDEICQECFDEFIAKRRKEVAK